MPTSKTILLRRAGRIAPQQMFSNADPWARIRPRAFVSVPGVTPVTLAPSRRAAGLRGLATPKVPQACCGSLWGATRHGACRSPPTIRRRIGAPQAPALGVRSRGFASGAVWGRERRTPQGAPTLLWSHHNSVGKGLTLTAFLMGSYPCTSPWRRLYNYKKKGWGHWLSDR
jgi:hypothetical protein